MELHMSNPILKSDPNNPNNMGWTKKGFIWRLVPNDQTLLYTGYARRYSVGYANGYVALPEDHKWYSMHYDEIPVDIHCGLTYSDYLVSCSTLLHFRNDLWVVGFDTRHGGDNLDNWSRENCYNEVMELVKQCEDVYEGVAYAPDARTSSRASPAFTKIY